MTATLKQFPQRDGLYQLLPEGVAVQNRYQHRVIMLDSLSSEIWLRADGRTSLHEIACDIAGINGMSISAMLRTVSILAVILNSEGILFPSNEPSSLPYHLTLPQEDQDAEQMRESLVTSGWLDQ
jgi:hypothetical protein